MRSIEDRWNIIERIQKKTEDWEIDKGIGPSINYERYYIVSYVKTEYFNTFCSKIGLDSQLMIDFCKDFASHIDSSKKQEDQHHKPFKELPVDINVADPILPVVIYEQPPFTTTINVLDMCPRGKLILIFVTYLFVHNTFYTMLELY